MKRWLLISLLAVLPLLGWGQGKVYTRRLRLENYKSRITRVVLPSDPALGAVLQAAVSSCWHINPFEFCTESEFLRTGDDPRFYFLYLAPVPAEESSPQVLALNCRKGGGSDYEKIDAAFDIVSIPVSSSTEGAFSEREKLYLPAFINIVQQFIEDASQSDRVAYGGLSVYNQDLLKRRNIELVFAEEDLSSSVDDDIRQNYFQGHCMLDSARKADQIFGRSIRAAVVSIVIAPEPDVEGAVFYKMLIGAYDHRLYHYSTGRTGPNSSAGFRTMDIKGLCNTRRN
ncbi:MAG: hypothetical protein MJY42_00010 [Bacteroidales bacterium]|nr:hypothetical protein [Bacteroidales bacterium]